jgi:hypothetical protein
MAACFAAGSLCFLVGPFPGYIDLVGPRADAITFFVGSILFTAGGALQTWLAFPGRWGPDWWVAAIQSAGTLFFNVTTFQALTTTLSDPVYDRLVWRPDALGSVCFLVSGAVGFAAAERRWWQPAVNLLGCVFFGASAIAGYVVPQTGSEIDLAAANWNTAAGAACFLACALPGLRRSPGAGDARPPDARMTS